MSLVSVYTAREKSGTAALSRVAAGASLYGSSCRVHTDTVTLFPGYKAQRQGREIYIGLVQTCPGFHALGARMSHNDSTHIVSGSP